MSAGRVAVLSLAMAAMAAGRAPAVLRSPDGAWRAGAPIDPSGGPLPDAAALRRTYDFAALPRAGETVTVHGTAMCIAREPCTQVIWRATTLGNVPGGGRLAEDFRLPRGTRVFLGTGPSPRVAITLIAAADGRVLGVIPLCDAPAGAACRNGYQPWEPSARH